MNKQPVLIIQGGAGSKSSAGYAAMVRKKLNKILSASYQVLLETDAVGAVTEAVRLLENDPAFNAGTGAQLQADGHARLSASIMEGRIERFAGVINLEKIKNPILVAHALLGSKSRVLAGNGAQKFARILGMKLADTRTAGSIKRWKKKRDERIKNSIEKMDTVGAVALDRKGNLASATSTGGRGFERPGRVSDSGMPVANFANDRVAVSATGIGEEIIEEGLAIKIATRVVDGMSLTEAFKKTFREVRSKNRKMGAVGLSWRGEIQAQTSTEVLFYGYQKGKRRIFF